MIVQPVLTDPISRLFELCVSSDPTNTKVGLFSFEAEHGREKLVFIAHGPEAEAFMRLLVHAAGPLFDAAEVPEGDAD